MATNKSALIRYKVLDRCLRNPWKQYYIEDLLEKCNEALREYYGETACIKKRQLLKDLEFMEDSCGYNAPIERVSDGNRRKYYRYADSSFSISNQLLSSSEMEMLKSVVSALSRFQGLPQFEWIDELSSRLDQEFQLETQTKIVSFDDNPYTTGRAFLADLYHYIRNEQPVRIIYRPFSKKEEEHVIHPYYLKQYNNRWFLLGWNEQYNRLSNFPIDRIESISLAGIPFRPNTEYDFDSYFDDIIGVTKPQGTGPEKVLLCVDASLWPYIQTKPLHGSQRIKQQNEQFTLIEIEVYINYELKALLLSFGERMEVSEPLSLREEIAAKISALHEKYSGSVR